MSPTPTLSSEKSCTIMHISGGHYREQGQYLGKHRLYIAISGRGDINISPYITMTYHTTPCHTMKRHIPYPTLYPTSYILSYTIPYHTTPYHTIPYHIISYQIISYHIISIDIIYNMMIASYNIGIELC